MSGSPLRLTVRPTGRGLLALVLGAVLLATGLVCRYGGVVTLGAGLLLLTGASLVSVLLPAPLTPSRLVSPLRVVRGGRCQAMLRIASGGGRLALTLDADERIGTRRVPVLVPRLAPGQVVEVDYPVPTDRRGVLPVGPLRLRRVGVAGLVVAAGTLGGTLEVHVLPRILSVSGLPAGSRRGQVGADERVERGGTDLVALREYVPGDDLRRVHWATSARSATLMVREDADPSRAHLTVLLEDRASAYAGDQFEDAVEVAAALITSVVGSGGPVRLASSSGRLAASVPAATPGRPAGESDLLLAQLAAADLIAGDPSGAAELPSRDLDVAVVVTGASASLAEAIAYAGRAPLGVVLVVDPARQTVEAHGAVLVLRAPRAPELLRAWDEAVAA